MIDYIKTIKRNIEIVCIIAIVIVGIMSYLTGEWFMLIGSLVTCFIVYFFSLGSISSAENRAVDIDKLWDEEG